MFLTVGIFGVRFSVPFSLILRMKLKYGIYIWCQHMEYKNELKTYIQKSAIIWKIAQTLLLYRGRINKSSRIKEHIWLKPGSELLCIYIRTLAFTSLKVA